jgi:PAS domain S-box-containing protein
MPPSVLDVVRSHGAPADAFSCLAEHMAEPVLLLDESGDIVFANNAASHLLGTDHPHDVTGQRLTADFLERDAVDFQRGGASDRSAVATEHRLHRADGTTLPVQIATVPLRRNGTTLTLATLHGIQKRRRLSTTLHRTLDLFHKVFHLGPAALMLVRLRDGVILEVSKQLLDLGGFSADALLGHTIHDALGAFYEGDYRAIARKLLRARRLRNQELRVSGTKGKERVLLGGARLVDVDGAACALLSLVDITERKAALEAERESRAKADHIFQASPAPLGIYRLADGQLLEANEALGTLLGYDRDALFEHAWSAVWADGDAHAALVERLRAEESVHDFKTNLQHASGKAVTVLGSFQRLSLDGVECVLMAMTDVTSREEARQALVDAKEKAEEAQRKSEEVAVFRSSVLANITHEVRTPLTTILGFTSVLHNGVDDRYKRFVRLIERSGNRLLLMLDSLLDLAQLEAGTMTMPLKPQCVQDVLHALSSPLQTRVEEEGLAFRLQVPTDERVCARLNEDLMSRVLTYLVDNAVKFTSEGHVALRMTATDTTVDVRVEDTGPGMAATFLPRAFDAFAQESEGSARDHQGSGLGLTVSRRIMEYMGGTIRIDTEKEKGTTIVLRLQRTEGCEPKLS